MPLLHCQFHAKTLGLATALNVILPQPADPSQIGITGISPNTPPHPPNGWPTLYLLHGLSDDHSVWLRRTSLERYAARLGLAIVMPNGHRSFYTDMATGQRYFAFLTEELPALCRSMFRLSDAREDNFVAGLSMGGYGAFKWALSHPDRFAAATSLSGALDMQHRIAQPDGPLDTQELTNIFGPPDRFPGSPNDLFALARNASANPQPTPKLYQCCGTDDFLIDDNHRFRDLAHNLSLDLLYEEHPGHAHTWAYWDQQIQRVLDWLPLPTDPPSLNG
ncbi:MAG: alpha/beta hydrolase family protein [Planctomycetota bacterium]